MSFSRIARLFVPSAVLMLCSIDTALGQTDPRIVSSAANVAFTITQPGVIPATQQIQITRSNVGNPFTLDVSITSDRGWLSASFVNNNPFTPATLNVSVINTSGLSGGTTYNGEIELRAIGALNTPLKIPVTLAVQGTGSQISALPTQLTFDVQSGSGAAAPQIVQVRSDLGTSIGFTLNAQTDNGGTWLQAIPSNPATPSDISVSVAPGALGAGTYTGRLIITPAGGLPAINVSVTMRVNAQATLNVTPATGLQFFFQSGQNLPPPQSLTISSSSSSIVYNVQASSAQGWLIPSSLQGTATTTGQQYSVAIGSVAATLPPGTYSGSLTFTATGISNSPVTIPVTLQVSTNPLLTIGTAPAAFNYATGGAVPPAQSVSISLSSSSTTITAFTATPFLPAGQNWLSVTPASGSLPATLQVGLNPAGLSTLTPGTYTGRVQVDAPGAANTPQSFNVTLNITASSDLVATPSTLTFNYQNTLPSPQPQQFEVTSLTAGVRFDATTTTNSCGATWLTVSPNTGGITPQVAQAAVNTAGLTPGICTGRINLTAQGSSTSTQVPVTLNVSATPLLDVQPSAIVFTSAAGGSAPASRTLVLRSTDNVTPLSYQVSAATTSGGPWLSLQGNTFGNTGAQIGVIATPGNLGAGTYEGSITVVSSSIPSGTAGALGQQVIPVRLVVTSNVTFTTNPTSLTFNMSQGGANPTSQTISLGSSGSQVLQYSASASSLGNWLSVTPANGATPGTVTVSVNGAGLVPSTYSGSITFLTPGAQNSTTTVPVTLVVGPPVNITPSITTLNFTYALGGANPPAQTVNLTLGGGATGSVNFTASAATTPAGGTWLSVSPNSGSVPGSISVSVSPSALTAGTYNGTVTVTPVGSGSPLTIPVTLTVTSAATPVVLQITNAANYQPGPVSPGQLVVIFGTNIGPPTLVGATLDATGSLASRVSDTEILFDNIPAPIVYVRGDQSAAVVPYEIFGRPTTQISVRRLGVTSTPVTLNVTDANPGFFTANQRGTGQAAALNENFSANSDVNPVRRGGVIQLFGTGEGQTTPGGVTGSITPSRLPLPTPRQPVTATIGGVPVTVEYAGSAPGLVAGVFQVNLRIPTTVPLGANDVVVRVGNTPAQAVTIAVGQ